MRERKTSFYVRCCEWEQNGTHEDPVLAGERGRVCRQPSHSSSGIWEGQPSDAFRAPFLPLILPPRAEKDHKDDDDDEER